MSFVKIDTSELGNAIEAIGSQWMLITVYDRENGRANAMTASWGAMGVLWNKNICICFVRPERHTYKLLGEGKELSVAFLPEEHKGAHKVLGRESGREVDKLKKCGLSAVMLDGVPTVGEAETALVCRVLYEDDIKEDCFLDPSLLECYANGGYHRFYICEIKQAYKKGE